TFTAQGKKTSIDTTPNDNWQHSNTMTTSAYKDDKKPLSEDIEITVDGISAVRKHLEPTRAAS
ncbi:unnamed protein product, partial [Didymodactylos carnosus]